MIKLRPIKLTKVDKVRFQEKVDQCDPSECWEWQAYRNKLGYGTFEISGSAYLAHRVAFAIAKGDTKLQVLHTCNNPSCCNPNHLCAGTQKDNIEQCVTEGRGADRRGEKHNCVKLTESDIHEIRVLLADGWLLREIAEDYGVDQSTISKICLGKLWKHI